MLHCILNHIHYGPEHWIISNRYLFITLFRLPIYLLVIDFYQSECLFLYICEKSSNLTVV